MLKFTIQILWEVSPKFENKKRENFISEYFSIEKIIYTVFIITSSYHLVKSTKLYLHVCIAIYTYVYVHIHSYAYMHNIMCMYVFVIVLNDNTDVS